MEKIWLNDNKIGDDGAKALAEVRRRCPCECSLERVNSSPYAFIAMLAQYIYIYMTDFKKSDIYIW